MIVCETQYLFHYSIQAVSEGMTGIMKDGLRPLSDFPDSERWQQIESAVPGFYKMLYEQMGGLKIIQKPYTNSGIFLTPINFRKLPGSLFYDKPRLRIPLSRIDTDNAFLMYVLDDERISLPVTSETMQDMANIWTADMVTTWFAKDQRKIFFHVPQIATYQGHVPVEESDYETADES